VTMKKKPDQSGEAPRESVDRGRYARLLADGYVVEVTPSDATLPKPRASTPSRHLRTATGPAKGPLRDG
jgi:hypothetical protein